MNVKCVFYMNSNKLEHRTATKISLLIFARLVVFVAVVIVGFCWTAFFFVDSL